MQPTENSELNLSPSSKPEVPLVKEESKPKPNFEMLMKINNLSNENYALKKEKTQLTEDLQAEIAKNKQLEAQLNDLNEQLNETNKSFDGLLERTEQLKKANDKLNSEKVFCMQEINLYKNQIAELTEAYDNMKTEMEGLKTELETGAKAEQEKSMREAELEKSLRMAEHHRDTWKAKALSNEIENENLKAEIEKLSLASTELKQQNEGLESQINHLNRKYQSLLQEAEKAKKNALQPESPLTKLDRARSNNMPNDVEGFTLAVSRSNTGASELAAEAEEQKSDRSEGKTSKPEISIEEIEKERAQNAEKFKKYEDEIETLKGHITILTKTLDT